MAVKRGQQTIDPRLLPLICLTFTTDDIALPISALTLEDASTHKELLVILGTFNPACPDVLTAQLGGEIGRFQWPSCICSRDDISSKGSNMKESAGHISTSILALNITSISR